MFATSSCFATSRKSVGALLNFWVDVRRELEGPGDDEGDWECNRDQYDHQPHDPIRNFQERENLRGNLNQEPRHYGIGNCNLVNMAPLQFGEEVAEVHGWSRAEGIM